MQLTKSDVIEALRLRAFALKFNLTQPMHPSKRDVASQELEAIENRLSDEDCYNFYKGKSKSVEALYF